MLTWDNNKQTAVTTLHHRQLALKVNNLASTLRLVHVQSQVKRRFVMAHFHALAFTRPPIAINAFLVAGFRTMHGLLVFQLGRP